MSGFPGLREALAAAEVAEAARLQKAADQQARAAALRAELDSGTATNQADAQQKYGQAAFFDELGILGSQQQPGRNDALNTSAFKLGRLVAAGVLEQSTVEAELTAVALAVGLSEHETASAIHSGLTAGLKKPRDLSDVGTRAGKRKEKPLSSLSAVTARMTPSGPDLPSADEIPDPEGEGGTYSDGQIKELLGLAWPVVDVTSDTAHGHRLHELAGDDLAFVAGLGVGGYVAWNAQQWLSGGKDGAGQVEAKRRVQGLGVFMQPETERLLDLYTVLDVAAKRIGAQDKPDKDELKEAKDKAAAMEKAYYKHCGAARRTEGDSKQAAILNSAKTLYVKDVHLFEPRPWVVGFQNGTWDKGEFRAAQRDDHMLTLAAVPYEPDADQSDWLEVLERITGGDADLALTLQDVAGYALSGASSLRLLPWLYGEGGTGKGTYSEMLATVLGDLSETINPKYLAADGDRERLGALIWGKRVVLCAEAGNARLDAESLKTLSGGDRLSVRMLYAEAFTAKASHVLLMVANDAPRVEAYDDALKDRVLALPFNHRLDGGAALLGGKRLEEMRQETSSDLVRGFAAWAVTGLARVYRTGKIHRAAACQKATRDFWADVDPLRYFWLLCNPSELALNGVSVAEFRAAYEQWIKDNGGRPLSAHKFNKAAKSVGLEQLVIEKVRRWKLVETEKFPSDFEADQTTEGEADNGLTDFDPNSLNSKTLSNTREREKEFRENTLKSVNPLQEKAAGWEGEDL